MGMKCEIFDTIQNGYVIQTLEDIRFTLKGNEHVVPTGYRSNGMSVPRVLWSVISPAIDNRTLRSSICHDWLYENHVCTRKEADQWYRDDLKANGYPTWKANLVYVGVRVGGGSHW